MRKLFKYCKALCGSDPELLEGDVFRFILPLVKKATGQATEQADPKIVGKILHFCEQPQKASDIQNFLQLKHRETFQNNYLKPLLKQELLALTIPDKPRSPSQQYKITEKGKKCLEKLKKEV